MRYFNLDRMSQAIPIREVKDNFHSISICTIHKQRLKGWDQKRDLAICPQDRSILWNHQEKLLSKGY